MLVNGRPFGDYRASVVAPIKDVMVSRLTGLVARTVGARADLQSLGDLLRADFQRHERRWREMGLWATGVYHFGVWANGRATPLGRRATSALYGLGSLLVELGTGCAIDRNTRIGTGLHLLHPDGVRIHPLAVIGERCGIMNDVTIGTAKGGTAGGAPRIGNDVFIGAGARILGPVTIGDGATVAANTLVITDVPPGATVIGVPGRVLPTARRAGERTMPAPAVVPEP
jgi:serine O-acetyltransferase